MPAVNTKLRQLDDPEIDDMYGTYLDRLIARPQMDFKCIIKGLVHCMPDAMHLKAEDKVRIKDEEVTMADDPLMQQIEQRHQWVMARKLKRKYEESDAADACDPKVMSLSTSGLVQGSDSGSMFVHEK